jgi:hypothetical protein
LDQLNEFGEVALRRLSPPGIVPLLQAGDKAARSHKQRDFYVNSKEKKGKSAPDQHHPHAVFFSSIFLIFLNFNFVSHF